MTSDTAKRLVRCLAALVLGLSFVAVYLGVNSRAGATSPIAECQSRTAAWAAANPAVYRVAGSPLYLCVDVPFTGWHARWVSSIDAIEINVSALRGDPALATLSVDRFYTGLLWHEIGHAYGDTTHSYLGHEAAYAALRPQSLTGKAPIEDYAFTFSFSLGHYDNWTPCGQRCPRATGWTPPMAGELANLRALGFMPRQ
jgi:hypothetical protein